MSIEGKYKKMKFRLETMLNTYNVRSKVYQRKTGQCTSVLFSLTTTKISASLEGTCNER